LTWIAALDQQIERLRTALSAEANPQSAAGRRLRRQIAALEGQRRRMAAALLTGASDAPQMTAVAPSLEDLISRRQRLLEMREKALAALAAAKPYATPLAVIAGALIIAASVLVALPHSEIISTPYGYIEKDRWTGKTRACFVRPGIYVASMKCQPLN
jgi:hypothetical protein